MHGNKSTNIWVFFSLCKQLLTATISVVFFLFFVLNCSSSVVLYHSQLYSILLTMFHNFLHRCVLFSAALLSWTGRLRSPERSLRNSGSMLPLLLPAVSRAYKHAAEHLRTSESVCLHYKSPLP